MKNWWYYHKWYVICGVILLGILVNLIGSYLGLWEKQPDCQIAYVGVTPLPDDTVTALEAALSPLCGDINGDGEATVSLVQYIASTGDDSDNLYTNYASEVKLIGDINDGDSYLFLMDDPQAFQLQFQVLAMPDGSSPADRDFSAEGKVLRWGNCPVLSALSLGSYTQSALGTSVSGDSQELLGGLYLGRRCFYRETKTTTAQRDGQNLFWQALTAGAKEEPLDET